MLEGTATAIWVRDGDAWAWGVITEVEKQEKLGISCRGAHVPASPSVFTCRTTVP